MSEKPTEQLLAEAQGGDESALMQLLFRFHQPLLAYISANLGGRIAAIISADDILQDTFVSAMRAIETHEGRDEASFFAWLRSIASNRIRDAARAEASKKRGGDRARIQQRPDPFQSHAGPLLEELAQDSTTASRIAATSEAMRAMQVAITTLPPEQSEALRLHYFELLSLDDTAKAMGRTTGSVRGLIQRAKQKLRDHMETASKWLSGG